MFDLINSTSGLLSDLSETDPDQDGTANMVTLDACFAALAAFDASELLAFTVKLLDLPTEATHILSGLRVVLS